MKFSCSQWSKQVYSTCAILSFPMFYFQSMIIVKLNGMASLSAELSSDIGSDWPMTAQAPQVTQGRTSRFCMQALTSYQTHLS